MKKLFPILFLLVPVAAACAPDIAEDPAPGESVIVNFDPAHVDPATGEADAIVPLPNDLARADLATGKIAPGAKIHVPPPPSSRVYTAAQKEFDKQYLETLDGFPYESTASVTTSGDLDPATVNDKTVLAFDVTDPAKPTPVAIVPTFADKKITIPPPVGNWQRAHTYAIATIAGPNGLKGVGGKTVIGSQTWALVSSRNPLVTPECKDLTSPACQPTVDIIPSHKEDAAERLAEQTKLALQLEALRQGYKPILDALAGPPFSADRSIVPLVWSFTIVDAGEMTFDPAAKTPVIPFPNDLARTGPKTCGVNNDKACIALPHPKTGAPLTSADCTAAQTDQQVLLVCGLNSLDGFSTIAPLISENSDKEGALGQGGLIDAKTLDPKTVGLVPLVSGAPAQIKTAPKWTPCLNCMSSANAAGVPQTTPQQLQWKLDVPLDESTTYFAYVTNGVKDTKGKSAVANPIFAFLRSSEPLVDAAGKTTINLISDAQAKQLEPIRLGFKAAFDGLEKAGIHRTDLALGFPFTTQVESSFLDKLYGAPTAAKALGLPDFPIATQDATALYTGAATAAGIPIGNIGKFYAGRWLTPVAVTGPGGTLNPSPTGIKILPVTFAISVPATPPPAGGYPVTIFGHGFTRSRNDFLAIANSLAAAGQLVIASDVLFHGERTSCTGAKAAIPMATTDDAACADPANVKCDGGFQGLCVLRNDAARLACPATPTDPFGDGACAVAGQGRCSVDKKCQGVGADFLRPSAGAAPVISGWNIFSLTNFFATRDNFRQQVIDLAQLVNIIKSTDPKKLSNQIALAGGTAPLDATKINYVGQSLGGILGTLFTAASPDVNNAVLNVPGGALVSIILNAPSFAAQKKALIDTLAGNGLTPGTPGFDQFLGIAQWVLDEADPANMAYRMTHPLVANPNRHAFIQFIEGDETVPNIANFAEVAAANRAFVNTPPNFGCVAPLACYEFTAAGDGFDTTSAPTNKRHGFLLSPPSLTAGGLAITTKAQTQAATFVATGAIQ